MTDPVNVAIVGATGLVGETMIEILQERKFPIDTLFCLASESSRGKIIEFNGKKVRVEVASEFDFSKAQIALFSAGSKVSEELAPKAAAAGCVVIDNTSYFRYQDDIPLVVAEVNPHAIQDHKKRNIIANPNCSTMQMLVALKPIYDAVGIERINVATYQSVSGSGKKAIEELAVQSRNLLTGQPVETTVYSQQIAFNALPHIDTFQENGYTREEMKMVWETQKIFEDDKIQVNPTAVRIPVFYGHSEAVHIETRDPITADDARALLEKAPGIEVVDNPEQEEYPTAIGNASGQDPVYVGRIRKDISHPNGLNLWIVADNIRKGAALNTVQIAEILTNNHN